jgi:formyl-CoA transferase
MLGKRDAASKAPDPGKAPPKPPLHGVRILAVEQLMSLPFGTQLLADFGADVVAVEPINYAPDQLVPWRLRTGRNKRRISVDLASSAGQKLVRQLTAHADIFVENYRPGVLDKYRLGYRTLHRLNPRLIYLSVSGFGHQDFLASPYSALAAYGPIAEAMSGVTSALLASGSSGSAGVALGDIVSSLFASLGLMIALRERDRSGRGQYVDISMVDSLFALAELPFVKAMLQRDAHETKLAPAGTFSGIFSAKDGRFYLIVMNERHWAALAILLDHPEWAELAWRSDAESQNGLAPEVKPTIETWAATQTLTAILKAARDVGLAVAPILSGRAIAEEPHFSGRNMLVEVEHVDGSRVQVPSNPIKVSYSRTTLGSGKRLKISAPAADTLVVLKDWLGLEAGDIAKLLDNGVVAATN